MGWFKRLRKPIAEYTALEEPEERQAGLLFPGGAYKKSEEARRKLIQEDERHFGKDCYEAKKRKEDVARTLLEQGKYDDAEKMYYEIVQENENRPYEGYFMLTAKFRLGQTLYEQGKYQTARKVLQEVAKKRERMLGKSHHDTLDSKQWLAGITVAERKEAQKAQSQKAIHGKEGMAGK
ncbi:hypothetical protein PENSTE_c025G08919 [Penicillium steckii]|uniref:Uncharacterized protein n=1 Tax=Penicillium steckii TaxID=303698 RepID=A0A1V6SQA1_9EURO|nr:hypothetical protein PENSTE_c025G08919 [Penicillium steckii]